MIISLHVNKIIFEKKKMSMKLDWIASHLIEKYLLNDFIEMFFGANTFFFYSFSDQCSNIAKKKRKMLKNSNK